MSEPTNILHVFSRMARGGAELRTVEVCRCVDPNRYRFHFGALSGRPGPLDAEIQAMGGVVHKVPLYHWDFPGRFVRLLREWRIGVVHSHVHYASGLILRLAARAGIPGRIAHFRSSHDGRGATIARRAFRMVMRRWIDRCATHILAVSASAMEASWGPEWKADSRCQVIYNGLDPAAFAPGTDPADVRRQWGIAPDSLVCIHVGSFRPPKNHARVVAIFRQVLSLRSDAWLLLVGGADNAVGAQVRRQTVKLGIAGRVCFCGERRDVPELLSAADVLVFPSLWEGLPGAVLEACAAGTPVVASRLPAVDEIARLLPAVSCVPLEASDAQWAEAVVRVAQSAVSDREAKRRAFAQSPFTLARCVSDMCRIWDMAAAAVCPGEARYV